MVLGVCRSRTRRSQTAEDAFQATFLVLVRKASQVRSRESLGGWLYRVAYRIAMRAEAAECRLDPVAGRLLQALWFDAGAEPSGRLLLVIHHFAVDGVSWRVLAPDLAVACQASAAGQAVVLPARTTSFRHWAQRLAARGQDAAVVSELAFWRGMLAGRSLRLVPGELASGALDPVRDVNRTAGHLTLTLPAGVTEPLLTRVPSAFRATRRTFVRRG